MKKLVNFEVVFEISRKLINSKVSDYFILNYNNYRLEKNQRRKIKVSFK